MGILKNIESDYRIPSTFETVTCCHDTMIRKKELCHIQN